MRLVVLILLIFGVTVKYSQKHETITDTSYYPFSDSNNITILPDFEIVTNNQLYLKKYRTTVYYVKRVYDYAQIASSMLISFQDTLETISSKRKKKIFIRRANKRLKAEFKDEIKDMSITRGEYLMKLIYRETNMTTYDIIKFYRGDIKAFWFQGLCKIAGQDLKREYNPSQEDMMIEKVVKKIEDGELAYIKRSPKTNYAKETMRSKREKRKIEKRKKRKTKEKK